MDKKIAGLINESLEKIIAGVKEIQVQVNNLAVTENETEDELPKQEVENEMEEVKEESNEEIEDEIDLEGIKELNYNELRKLASSLGVTAKGKKEVILDAVLDYYKNEDNSEEEEVEEPKEDTVEKVEEIEEIENVEEEVEEIEETEELEEDEEDNSLYEKVRDALAEYSEEELADILESVGKSPKGKRQALLSKLVDAIEEGLIEIEFEEDDGEESEEKPEESVEDEVEYVDEEEMTEPRRQKIIELRKEIENVYKSGGITDKDIKKLLEEYNQNSEECSECICPSEDRLSCYRKLHENLVDDDGEMHKMEEPYYINDRLYCCGKSLRELSDNTMYCEVCGTEYELE